MASHFVCRGCGFPRATFFVAILVAESFGIFLGHTAVECLALMRGLTGVFVPKELAIGKPVQTFLVERVLAFLTSQINLQAHETPL
jgi:hypothetical protein